MTMRLKTILPLLPVLGWCGCNLQANDDSVMGDRNPLTPAATTIVAQHSGACLDVRGGPNAKNDGAPIEQWTCTGQANQSWSLEPLSNGSFRIAAESSGKCVTAMGTGNGDAIQQTTCSSSRNQAWKIETAASGVYRIVSASSGLCLDVTGGPSATADGILTELWECTGQANQTWKLTLPSQPSPMSPAPASPTKPAQPPGAEKSGIVVAKHSGKCLDVRGGPAATNDGALIEQWSCSGEANQTFTFKDMGSGHVAIVAKNSGKCIDLAGAGSINGTAVQQATCNGAQTQLWNVRDVGGGQSEIVSVFAKRCLDVTGGPGATADGVLTALWDCTGGANQSWAIGGAAPPASSTPPPPATVAGPFGQDASQWTLTFDEEFEGNALDTKKWVDHLWYQGPDPTPNYAVSNGSLKIWPVPGTNFKRDYRHLTTDEIYYQTYGYFEMEAKLPYGRGPWPAFWLYNHDVGTLRPEIDIMEAYPGGGPNSGWSDANLRPTAFAATIWTGPEGALGGSKVYQGPDLSAGFHRYAVKWEPNKQTFYFDGTPFYSVDVSMSSRMYILLSYQFGSASGQADGTTPMGPTNAFEVRYVRAWKAK